MQQKLIHRCLFTNTQVNELNFICTDIKFLKAQLEKIKQSCGFLGHSQAKIVSRGWNSW